MSSSETLLCIASQFGPVVPIIEPSDGDEHGVVPPRDFTLSVTSLSPCLFFVNDSAFCDVLLHFESACFASNSAKLTLTFVFV